MHLWIFYSWKVYKGDCFEDQIEVIRILNGYENSDRNIFSHLRKIVQLEDTR